MLDTHDAPAAWPASRPNAAAPPPDDWLAVDEADLRDAHAEACALYAAASANPGARLRHARSVVLLEQLLAARAGSPPRPGGRAGARASFRADRAPGYRFGGAGGGGDPTGAPASDRALAAALRHVHGLVFGMAEAHRIAESDPIEVGDGFGDGLLAAEADLHAFLDGPSGAARPTGLLAGLPWAGCACGGDPTARPN